MNIDYDDLCCDDNGRQQLQSSQQTAKAELKQDQKARQKNCNIQESAIAISICDDAKAIQIAEQSNSNLQYGAATAQNRANQVQNGLGVLVGCNGASMPALAGADAAEDLKIEMNEKGNVSVNGKEMDTKELGEGLKMVLMGG